MIEYNIGEKVLFTEYQSNTCMDIDLGSISYSNIGIITKKITTEVLYRKKIKRNIEYYISFKSKIDNKKYIKMCDNNIVINKGIKCEE